VAKVTLLNAISWLLRWRAISLLVLFN